MTDLPDAHTHPSATVSGSAPRFVCGTSPADWKQVATLAEQDAAVTPFFGVHPWYLTSPEQEEYLTELTSLLKRFPHAGLGETGLDKCRKGIPPLSFQKQILAQHLELAAQHNRPVTLHCCRAWGTLASILPEHPGLKAIFHGWTGAIPIATLPRSSSLFFSIGLRELQRPGILSSIPPHRLLLESDGHPESLPEVYRRTAQELDMTVNNLVNLIQCNMETLIPS